jgi:hypothetical protein
MAKSLLCGTGTLAGDFFPNTNYQIRSTQQMNAAEQEG